MHIMLTTRCNMHCAHCCFSCEAKGHDMSRETFIKALELAEGFDSYIFFGGGEPTLHPRFWEFLGLALGSGIELGLLGMVTNGKCTKDALRLAQIARKGIMSVELSRDEYHEEIDPEVVKAFSVDRWNRDSNDLRGIRTVMRIMKMGRAEENGLYTEDEGCPCDDLFIATDGRIFVCGHMLEQLGTVYEPDYDGLEDYFTRDVGCSIEFKPELAGVERKAA